MHLTITYFLKSVNQQLRIVSRINIAMRKNPARLTAGKLSNDYKNTVKALIKNEKAVKFLSEIKGSLSY